MGLVTWWHVVSSWPRDWTKVFCIGRWILYHWATREALAYFDLCLCQMFKLDLEKAEEPEIKLTTSVGSSKKQESSRKKSTSALLTMPKTWTVWITINCGKFWKRWEYQTTWPASWETYMQVRKQQLELDMEQQTVSKSGKKYVKAVYRHLAYLTNMKSASWEVPSWMKRKLESRFLGEISITSDMQMTPPFGKKWRRNKEPLDENNRGECKSWLKTQHSEN